VTCCIFWVSKPFSVVGVTSICKFIASIFRNSDVRQPRCVSLYNGKELRVEYTQSNTTILTSIINIMRVLITTCFGLTCRPSSGCKIRLDKLYYNAWETFWEKGAVILGVPWSRFTNENPSYKTEPWYPQHPRPLLPKCFPCIIV